MKLFNKSLLKKFSRDEKGVHAIEFAIIASFFMGAGLVATDLGVAINKRMVLDHAVRASAQYLMQNETNPDVLVSRAIEAAAISTYTAEQTYEDLQEAVSSLNVSVTKTCYCPDTQVEASCTALCPNADIPSVFYDYKASQLYDAMYLPDFQISVNQRFQTR